jgi:LysM repeat protein
MMNKRLKNSYIFITALGVASSAGAYIVQKDDTLSSIAYKNISTKVYGKDGSLEAILALNPQIKDSNFIKPGQFINIGEIKNVAAVVIPTVRNIAEDSQNYVEVNNSEMADNDTLSFKGVALWALTPFYNITNLSATDNVTGSDSVVASKYHVGINASYVQDWSKDFQTAINLKLASIAFEEPASSTNTLKDTSKFLSTIGLETNHNLSEKTHLKLGASYGKELFIRAASTTSTAIDAVNISSISSKLSYDIKDLSPLTLGVSVSYAAKMPTKVDTYKLKFGHEYGASLYLKQLTGKSQNSNIQTELGYTQRKQDTSFSTQTETNITLGVRIFFGSGSGL